MMPGPASEALWKVSDVAIFLKASPSFVYQHAEDGTLPCLRIGGLLRFEPERVRAFARGEVLPHRSEVPRQPAITRSPERVASGPIVRRKTPEGERK